MQAYPLQWPHGWPRTTNPKSSHPFGGSWENRKNGLSFDKMRRELSDELRRLGATNAVLSTNLELRLDGQPYAPRRALTDAGVAVYFMLKGRQMVMAQDGYADIAANIRAITLAIDNMRGLERHGGGAMMERAFTGFAALPPPSDCWSVLELKPRASASDIETAYRRLAKHAHPDAPGGSHEKMSALNAARDAALLEVQP